MTQKKILVLLIAILPMVMTACHDDDDDLIGLWTRLSDLDGLARSDASYFTIGDKGYIVCGFNGKERLNDLWVYDMDKGGWTQKADFPGTPRNSAVAFAVNGKGYMGTGYNPDTGSGSYYLNDFWEYNPDTDRWTQKTDFPGTSRTDAVAFAVGGKGYIGCGYDGNYLKDFYAYNPDSDSWESILSLVNKRRGACSFVIDGVAYLFGGHNNQESQYDFWRFDPTNGWQSLRDIADTSDDDYDDDYDMVGVYRSAFVIDGCGYVTCGETAGGSLRRDTWKYYPATDIWEEVAKFKGTTRTSAVSFSNGVKGIITTGKSGSYYFDDTWIIDPYTYDDDDY